MLNCGRLLGIVEHALNASLPFQVPEFAKSLIVDPAAWIIHNPHLICPTEGFGHFVSDPLGEAFPQYRLGLGVVSVIFGVPDVGVFVGRHRHHPFGGHVVEQMDNRGFQPAFLSLFDVDDGGYS